MQIHLYALCWNEQRMIPLFLQHYERFVDRFFIFDDASDDVSVELLQRHPLVEVRPIHFAPDVKRSAAVLLPFYENAWKESRGAADWVILCNIDELFHHADARSYLREQLRSGVTWIPTRGYDIISLRIPGTDTPLVDRNLYGVRKETADKVFAFRPDAIEETGFARGRHTANPRGVIVEPNSTEVRLLHLQLIDPIYYFRRRIEKRRRNPPQYYMSVPWIVANWLRHALKARRLHLRS